ncbi:NAD(P)/FAD-dependent oxidoreductase [Nocardia sp. CNY236]|uniref:flavin-containing monooxygenase n=1 Tax=Nocardia sp. CNY236 TaxID=1169152 RepID=UPI0004112C42|nr:NAD(P)/FAD-dependent oxidoreductase [Nocardia sp. CNY236]
MTCEHRIGIVGAGVAGLACAKVLKQEGFSVEVFDRAPDVGGVWSATRRYPGLRAQNSKATFHFSDFPMPATYPHVVDGHHMQAYLAAYAEHFGLAEHLRLRTDVLAADPVDTGWLLQLRDAEGIHRRSCDHLVVANGAYGEPLMPEYRGAEWFRQAGGQLWHSSEFLNVESVRGKSVVVVGYGTSACEIATAVSDVAASTDVVARRLVWKVPRTPSRMLDYERLMLTRFGEAHFDSVRPGWVARFLAGPGESVRISNFDLIQELVTKRLGLRELGLVPDGRFEEIADSGVGIATNGFFDRVAAGRIVVHRDATITEMIGGPGPAPAVGLSTGQVLQADVVVCATGFQQHVPFLAPYIQRKLTDERGNFRLYRQILPLDVPKLTFVGYNPSLISTLSAEVAAHWTAALLAGRLHLPPATTLGEQVDDRLRWMAQHTHGRRARGAVNTPASIQTVDEMLADLKFRLPLATRAAQWLRPIRPESYRRLAGHRHSAAGPRPTTVEAQSLAYDEDRGPVSR